MSSRTCHAAWLLVAILFIGCQSSGRMARGPQPASPPAQARNQPLAAPRTPPQGMASTTPGVARPPAEFPPAPAKEGDKLVIRATAPSSGEPVFSPSDAHHPAAPPPPAHAAQPVDKVRELYELAVAKDAQIRDYTCRFRRREVVRGKQLPEDVLLFRHLKQPNSIYFKWQPGTQNDGRELIWVQGQFNNQIQVRTGKGDLLAGIRTELDPRSERATQNSRRTIEEAGLPNMLQRYGVIFAARQASDLQYAGPQRRPESRTPMECVAQRVAPGQERHLPQGGTRYWFFSTDSQAPEQSLPMLIVTLDEARREVEYYCFDQFRLNTGLGAQDFNPDSLWGKR